MTGDAFDLRAERAAARARHPATQWMPDLDRLAARVTERLGTKGSLGRASPLQSVPKGSGPASTMRFWGHLLPGRPLGSRACLCGHR
jgi:hypothetical protein